MLKHFKNNSGISIFIAIGFSTAIILIALGLNSVVTSFLVTSGNIERMNQSYFAAEGGIEDALYDLSEHTFGYENEISKTDFTKDNNTAYSWKIKNRVPKNIFNNTYIIPPKGEGTSKTDPDWNKLGIGESSEINLFLDNSLAGNEATDGDIMNISDPSFSFDFLQLKVKLPPDSDTRLDTTEAEEVNIADDTILTWTFSGEDNTDPNLFHVLKEKEAYDKIQAGSDILVDRREDESTEIYESKINARLDNGDQIIMDSRENNLAAPYSTEQIIGRGLDENNNPETIEAFLANNQIHKPGLKLSLVSRLFDTLGQVIPYLEYQIIVSSSKPIPDEFFTISSTGYAQNFKQTIVSKIKKRPSVSLLDFVIFQ